ncbi:MAG: hypothetical protein IPO07_26290 [Haliscomenobacter sp.]|nr:hypothetical protein [Haliscomenobacter sp.]MBK9491918.1 hypothetical protein [Haliscomenobacter sp.]
MLEDLAPGMLTASFQTELFEKRRRLATDNVSVKYSPYTSYAGMEIPKTMTMPFEVDVNTIRLVDVDKISNRR